MSVIQVFTRWPVFGQVKTRLAKDIGDLAAFGAYLQLLNHVLSQAAFINVRIEIWLAVDNRFNESSDDSLNYEDCLHQWQSLVDNLNVNEAAKKAHHNISNIFSNKKCQFYRQAEGDLGEKLTQAFQSGWTRHKNVLIIGGDSVSVNSLHLKEAFDALQNHEMVLIPAEDGGIVLIGASNNAPINLNAISWGTDQVYKQLNVKNSSLKIYCLKTGWDVDRLNDWQRFLKIREPL
ncbi:MAG: TIGR04282 family arsenosugar biosynthesis glycosyltransferase [Pseudomonadota bacterium]